jgi:pilus assembly protein CpaF
VQISEVTGLHGETINMHDLFIFRQTGVDEQQSAKGHFEASGILPNCLTRFESYGLNISRNTFAQGEKEIDRLDTLRGVR